jgi:hypothetical protein
MLRDELLERLQEQESHDLEVKEAAWGVPEDAYKTVCAFAKHVRSPWRVPLSATARVRYHGTGTVT